MMKYRIIAIFAVLLLLIAGCSKEPEEYNKPAAYWYGKMIEAISDGNLDKADNYYSSLQSEHIGSPLLPEATLIMAISHLQYGEYLLADHFLTEYIKRYASPQDREYAEYMQVKAKYMALPRPRRDQGLIDEAISDGEAFKRNYPDSIYYPVVDTMVTRLYLSEASLNESIAELYGRLDKPRGEAYYRSIKPQPWIDWNKVEPAQEAWYRSMFTGNGHGSWYAFLLPDTINVVARHSHAEEENNATDGNASGSAP
jgi:outer membrane protein assembly factor BamD